MSDKKVLVKVHEAYRWVVALCDVDVKDKILQEGQRKLDLTGAFFEGEVMSEEQVREQIEQAVHEDATFNIVGKISVGIAKDMGLINDEGIMTIEEVPYALVLV